MKYALQWKHFYVKLQWNIYDTKLTLIEFNEENERQI